uniref:Uncharacterized protein n=1 Tax=viral metagenome TaxID=1070528 RepID=A0A6M3LHG2_9ZZZZ
MSIELTPQDMAKRIELKASQLAGDSPKIHLLSGEVVTREQYTQMFGYQGDRYRAIALNLRPPDSRELDVYPLPEKRKSKWARHK